MNKKGHRQLTLLVAATAVPAILVFPESTTNVLLFELGVVATLHPYLNPDLDYHNRKWTQAGELLGFEMYSSLIPHRSGMNKKDFKGLNVRNIIYTLSYSHWPLIGTLPRTIMAFIPILLIVLIARDLVPIVSTAFVWIWLGMSWSDLWHVVSDKLYSYTKERKKRYGSGELTGSYWRSRKKFGRKNFRRRWK